MITDLLIYSFIFTITMVSSASLMPHVCQIATKRGLLDLPGGRKDHEKAIPPVGGLVIIPVFVVMLLIFRFDFVSNWALLVSLSIIMFTGYIDDKFDLAAWLKFFIQFIAASILVIGGNIHVESLGNFIGMGEVSLGSASVPFTIFCVMLLINAINMIDGIDGLAGGVTMTVLFWVGLVAASQGDQQTLLTTIIIGASLAGFLVHNMRTPFNKSAKVFLGDSGSMALGLILAWLCIGITNRTETMPAEISAIAVAWILSIPVMDAFALFVIRSSKGRSPFSADRLHFHYHFIDAGVSAGKATPLIMLLSFIVGAIGVTAAYIKLPDYYLTFSWSALLLLHTYVTSKPQRYISFIKNFSDKSNSSNSNDT